MKTDMRIFNLFNTRKRVVDRNDMDYSNKKGERIKDIDRDIERRSILIDRKKSDFEDSFRETFDNISKAKKDEQNRSRIVEDTSGNSNSARRLNESRQNLEKTKNENFVASESAEKKIDGSNQQDLERTIQIIRDSLAVVSKKLGLNIDFADGILKDFKVENLSADILEQFSEILYALKGISQLLGKAAQENVALDINGNVIEPHEAAALEQILRVEMFQLEVAFESLGIAGNISRTVAEKMQVPAMDGGIPKAANPTTLSMPENQLEIVLGTMLKTEEEKIKIVVGHIAQLAKEQKPESGTISELKNQVSKVPVEGADAEKGISNVGTKNINKNPMVISIDFTKSTGDKSIDTNKGRDLWSFDPQVLRQLLKIDDNRQNNAVEAKSDGNTQKPSFLSFSSGSSFSSNQNFQQLLNSSQDFLGQVSQTDTSAKTEGQPVNFADKFPVTPIRNLEELVMQQVSRRLASAVKNGVHEVRLILKPESLGDMRMTIQMEGDIVTARISVENQHVKQIVESNLQSLKDSLEEQNLQAGAFDVSVDKDFQSEENDPSGSQKGDRLAGDTDDMPDDSSDWGVTLGTETGRRFGSNTIEYFA